MKRVLLFFVLFFSSAAVSFADFDINYDKTSSNINVEIKDKNSSNGADNQKAYLKIEDNSAINQNSYNKKAKEEEVIYSEYEKELGEDYYTLYRIVEKILRANNLSYQNWRVAIVRDTEDFNAFSTAGNLIAVNSALYDTYFDNEDALASVLAHEIGHLILKHQRSSNIDYTKAEVYGNMRNEAKRDLNRKGASSAESLVNGITAISSEIAMYNAYKRIRKLEYEADEKAIELVSRAGYNPRATIEVLNFSTNMTGVYTPYDSHPEEKERIKQINKIIDSSDLNRLKSEGQRNLYNSEPLKIKRSSDRKTLIITRASNSKNSFEGNSEGDN